MTFNIVEFFENPLRYSSFRENVTRIPSTLKHTYVEDNISLNSYCTRKCFDKISRENQNTHFMINITYFSKTLPHVR